jgi:hypothetical protein
MKKYNSKSLTKSIFTLIIIVLTQFLVGYVFAQNGTIRGTIYEEATGEPLFGVSVLVRETGTGAISDFDGKFEVQVAPGTYTFRFLICPTPL